MTSLRTFWAHDCGAEAMPRQIDDETLVSAPGRSGPEGPLQTALQESTIAAATTRATEGQSIFGPIAAFLEQHRSQTSGLPPHLQSALASLSDVLAAVAQRHFNAFISGIGQENLRRCEQKFYPLSGTTLSLF
jgi:hypothetical protein